MNDAGAPAWFLSAPGAGRLHPAAAPDGVRDTRRDSEPFERVATMQG